MATRFTDEAGRQWLVPVNVASVKRCRELTDVDLLSIVDDKQGSLMAKLSTDPILLCNVLYALCKEQADNVGVTDEQFGAGLAGDALDSATRALLESLVAFFPKGKRELLAAAVAKMQKFQAKAESAALARLNSSAVDSALDSALTEALQDFCDSATS